MEYNMSNNHAIIFLFYVMVDVLSAAILDTIKYFSKNLWQKKMTITLHTNVLVIIIIIALTIIIFYFLVIKLKESKQTRLL